MSNNILIIKRDQAKEPYSENNVFKVVKAAGLNESQAQNLSESITNWINSVSKTEISSLDVRDQVLERLKTINEDAANLYAWYESTKDNNQQSANT